MVSLRYECETKEKHFTDSARVVVRRDFKREETEPELPNPSEAEAEEKNGLVVTDSLRIYSSSVLLFPYSKDVIFD